jgi:cell division septation protein DedD
MSQSSRKFSPRNTPPSGDKPRQGNPLLTGVLIGLVLGVGLCSGIAIWIARSPSPFTNRALQSMGIMKGSGVQPTGANSGELDTSAPNAVASSGADGSLPSPSSPPIPANSNLGREAGGVSPTSPPAESVTTAPNSSFEANKPSASASFYVQVGAFTTPDEAQKQVEVVAQLTGLKAKIWPSSVNDSSKVFYRVRVGPYNQTSETNELTQILKSNSLSYVLVRAAAGEAPQ